MYRPDNAKARRPRDNCIERYTGDDPLPSTDSGERIYAIGDIHGRLDLLRLLLDKIGAHSNALPPARSLYLVFVGDIVDRGPHSAEVMEMLYDLQRKTDHVIVLLGNHEEAMLQALDGDMDALRGWLAVGGEETLASFGVAPLRPDEDRRAYLQRARAAIPREWIAWLRRLPLSVRSGDYYFVHAGIRPGVALHRQTRNDMLWIRDDFLEDRRDHGAVIVHGHSVTPRAEIRANRICVDTGAYRTGVLSAIYLEGEKQEVIVSTLDDRTAPSVPGQDH
ncbi:metallophosphoesterase family protein [Sphingomonas sp. 3-13AW]|uniref:metallophosphoesterase family protein n=1 Tax=Sphingomonas sp. 3-13AW TaxID=3050450 RepID=UPI003BB50A65